LAADSLLLAVCAALSRFTFSICARRENSNSSAQ
jgi:hypothetical protein